MTTTPGSEPEVEETKAEQLPPPPETIYVAELDPTSPEYRAAAEERTEEDRGKADKIRDELEMPEENERNTILNGIFNDVIGTLRSFLRQYSSLCDQNFRDGLQSSEINYYNYCNSNDVVYRFTHRDMSCLQKLQDLDISEYSASDQKLIRILRKLNAIIKDGNNEKVILGILEDIMATREQGDDVEKYYGKTLDGLMQYGDTGRGW